MAQKKVTEFFNNRKRAEVLIGHASKRAKLDTAYCLRKKHLDIQPEKTRDEILAVTTSSTDDHDQQLSSSTCGRKRARVRSPQAEGFKTPTKGFDFSTFASGGLTEDGSTVRRKLARRKIPVEPKDTDVSSDKEKALTESKEETCPVQESVQIDAMKGKEEKSSVQDTVQTDVTKSDTPSQEKTEEKLPVDDKRPDPEAMKARLLKCGNLTDLKAALARFNEARGKLGNKPTEKINASELKEKLKQHEQSKDKLKQLQAEKTKPPQEATEVENETTVSSDKKPEAKTAPAYERYQSLAEPGVPTLRLPEHYNIVLDTFRNADNIVRLLDNRSEICTFDKLRNSVEVATRRKFELKHLGQFKTVYPTAYFFRQEKNLPCVGGVVSDYQLTVEANLDDSPVDADATVKEAQSQNLAKQLVTSIREKIVFTATKLIERKNRFQCSLVDLVRRLHSAFLSKLNIPNVADNKLTRWHPKFLLEEIPEIEAARLPQKPEEKKVTSAAEALKLHKDQYDKRIQRALEIVASKKQAAGESSSSKNNSSETKSQTTAASLPATPSKVNKNEAAAKAVPQDLLARIRAKEAQNAQKRMTRTPAEEERLERLQRVPELIRILRTYFVGQKRPAIPIADAIQTFQDSYRSSLGPVEAEQHLRLMAEVVPRWMQIVRISKGEYVKIDSKAELGVVISEVQKKSTELEYKV